ncbi:hypothetical protein SLEP1_g3003 [Rubroshorea leprosula]|uniref:Uncharacterized protein n=1 Tax=Rubroshorea leprosula TaxID=152421 RepID=A0AAV5HQF8_9ROSI|nr:hypothetical protein SLEP1_g3003 [Rubroshorea leprosula]
MKIFLSTLIPHLRPPPSPLFLHLRPSPPTFTILLLANCRSHLTNHQENNVDLAANPLGTPTLTSSCISSSSLPPPSSSVSRGVRQPPEREDLSSPKKSQVVVNTAGTPKYRPEYRNLIETKLSFILFRCNEKFDTPAISTDTKQN